MAKERVSTFRNTGTASAPNWEKYFVKTLAECILMSDADNETKTIKDYVDETISNLVNGAPEELDTLKEIADAIASNQGVVDAINAAITNKANKTDVNTALAGKADKAAVDGLEVSKADKSELLYTNSTPTVQAHGGVAAGTTFNEMPVVDVLNKILYPWVAPAVTASATPNGGTFEKGSSQTVTSIKVNVTKKSANITKVEVFNGSTSLGSKSGTDLNTLNSSGSATFTFTVSASITANQNFTAKVTDADSKVTSANTGSFSFVYPYYYGVISSSDDIANEIVLESLTKKVEAKGTKTIPYTASNQKMVFATPHANGVIKTITDPNGFNVTDTFEHSTVTITGLDGTAQTYDVYVSDPTTVTSFSMKFAH